MINSFNAYFLGVFTMEAVLTTLSSRIVEICKKAEMLPGVDAVRAVLLGDEYTKALICFVSLQMDEDDEMREDVQLIEEGNNEDAKKLSEEIRAAWNDGDVADGQEIAITITEGECHLWGGRGCERWLQLCACREGRGGGRRKEREGSSSLYLSESELESSRESQTKTHR